MVYAIRDAIEGKEQAHRFFVRFGKGVFNGRFILKIGKTIKGSFENVPGIILFLSEISDIEIEGKILSKKDIDGLLHKAGIEIIEKKNKKIIEYEVKGKTKKNMLKEVYRNSYFLLLDVRADGIEFKCKKKLPKPNKKAEVKIDKNFFSLKLNEVFLNKFRKEFLFDVPENNKKIEIIHTIVVDNIIIPKDLEKYGDYEKIRLSALREGKIIRKIKVNGKEIIKQYKFKV